MDFNDPVQIDNPDKNDQEHPALSGALWQRVHHRQRSGRFRDVDYDLEPFQVRRANETKGSMSKPRDDLETAMAATDAHARRRGLWDFSF